MADGYEWYSKISKVKKKEPLPSGEYVQNPLKSWMDMLDLKFLPESPAGRIRRQRGEEEKAVKMLGGKRPPRRMYPFIG